MADRNAANSAARAGAGGAVRRRLPSTPSAAVVARSCTTYSVQCGQITRCSSSSRRSSSPRTPSIQSVTVSTNSTHRTSGWIITAPPPASGGLARARRAPCSAPGAGALAGWPPRARGVADLGGRQPLDVAQLEHGALGRRQRVDDHPQLVPQLGSQHTRLREVLGGRRRRPVPGPASLRSEAVGIDGRFVLIEAERQGRERSGAPLALATRAGPVDEDAEHPRLERRAALEPADPLHDTEEGLLHHVLGGLVGGHVLTGDALHRPVVAIDELTERRLVADPERGDEQLVRRVSAAAIPRCGRSLAHGAAP